ncbi:hypothetical protein B296_00047309 [Ensete ventricosum]|uniref:Uncharacterized protein n=1 Tax=Ensete ventricosum TaxID=4639 RepID=A0A426XQF7_ENSVE|nr:hypothetical protein B296_00047309 [Ensete ventricosum]
MTTARFLSGAPPQIPAWILVRSAPAFFWQSEDAHEHMKKVRKSYLANALYLWKKRKRKHVAGLVRKVVQNYSVRIV